MGVHPFSDVYNSAPGLLCSLHGSLFIGMKLSVNLLPWCKGVLGVTLGSLGSILWRLEAILGALEVIS